MSIFNHTPKNNYMICENDENTPSIMPLFTEISGQNDSECKTLNTKGLPILALRNMVLFPGVAIPVNVGRTKSLQLIKDAQNSHTPIGVVCQRDAAVEDPGKDDLYEVGVIGEIIKILEMPDESTTVILQGKMKRFRIDEITETFPYMRANVSLENEILPDANDKEFEALVSALKDLTFELLKNIGEQAKELVFAIRNIDSAHYLVNFLGANIPLSATQKQELLTISNIKERLFKLYEMLTQEAQLLQIKADIQSKTREDLNQQQREHFLQQQIRTIQEELGGNMQDQDIQELRERAEKKKWDSKTAEIFEKEMRKLERLHPQSPDFSVQYTYLDTLLELPWNEYTQDNFNLNHVQKQLDKDHYGLDKVKERIIEHLAVLKLRGDMKSPIICLYGPPGVGKTSLGRSIAAALKRKYIRMSLGGVHDEAEVRGHRKTYIGAMPGRIIKSLIKAGSSNPVFILDEIDKVSSDRQGDPSSALLEVLDPEQNTTFHDNFLDVDYDLSKVMFIATANNLNTIPGPLLDRMELIEVSGYITEEKIEIARRHLVPKELEANGMKKNDIKIPKNTLEAIIESYTRESGVRELEKKIGKILRKSARQYATDGYFAKQEIKPGDLYEFLGAPEYTRDKYQGNDYAGVVTGLAWTAVGGEILFVETSLSRGKGGRLTLTGNLGDVMKESAMLALEYIKAHASLLNLDEEIFDNWNIHVHVPEGAIPKDGPSAGITMATSLASALTQRKVKANLAMTGEITLRGKVLPVGGIKEKILAAKRAGIKNIILSEENRKNIDEIQEIYLKGLTFHYVKDVKEVFAIALTNEKVADAIDLSVKKEKTEKKAE